ncbi:MULTISPECIES: hypothetical protein [Kordiimonas]|jgi:hypothetical protein|uniref:hypothetical protein n=1 Tax=Kordiimonas TaxID=288021 RepID=UPI00257E369B|nr:hypothetical protein [Kordiimonas sp. UBA4487]
MNRHFKCMIDRLDRFLPVLALSVALFLQGLLASGTAASMVVPGLVAPDGTALTLSDICNNTEDGRTGHCHACVHAPVATLTAVDLLPDIQRTLPGKAFTAYAAPQVSRPEASFRFHTGPPKA